MKRFKRITATLFAAALIASPLLAGGGEALASKLGLNPSSKVGKKWEKIMDKESGKEIGADKLTPKEREELLKYLVSHAADSDQPTAPR